MRKKEKQEKSLVAFVSGDELPKDIVHPDFGKEETKAKRKLSTITISPHDVRDYAAHDVVPPRTVTWESTLDGSAYRTYVDYTYPGWRTVSDVPQGYVYNTISF